MKKHSRSLFLLSFGFMAALTGRAFAETAQEYDDAGMALFRAGLYDKSLQYFSSAVQTDPQDWQGYQDMGDAYMKLDNKPSALQSYQQALQINPNIPGLQTTVNNLNAQVPADSNTDNGDQQPQASTPPPPNNNGYSNQPGSSVVVVQHRPWRRPRVVRTYKFNDNLAPMDHAPFWAKAEFGYNYSAQTDLINSANTTNSENNSGTLFSGFTNANATMSQNGYQTGGELGFLINPYNGIAIGARLIESSDYTLSAFNSAPSTVSGAPNDFENATFSPFVVPITLDYYLFLPDSGGRFFLSAGVGYYAALVHINENYSLSNNQDNPNAFGNPVGDLTSGNIGFQVAIGRDFAINDFFGISVYARGHYAQITNFRGTLSDGNQYALVKFSDNTVDIDNPANIGTNGEQNATIDFTGFDVGLSLNFYSF